MKILFKVTGSISVYKICEVVSRLRKQGHEVKLACSKNSLNFVGASTWEGLSGHKVFTNDFAPGQRMEHIYLNDWADLVVLAPASAKSLNEISQSVGSSVITTLFLARKKEVPYLIFPAMNPRMWKDENLKKSLEQLSKLKNVFIYEPKEGALACGHMGKGRLWEPENILEEISRYDKKEKTVVVTFGGTSENIDGVRAITNFSTGKTGIEICKGLSKKFRLIALLPKSLFEKSKGLEFCEKIFFTSSDSLRESLFEVLSKEDVDFVFHSAAVSDFIPEKQSDKKISSQVDLILSFKKNPKILNEIKEKSKNKNLKLISFKLTHNNLEEEIKNKIQNQLCKSGSDFVVHNKLSNINQGQHIYVVYNKNFEAILRGKSKENLVKDLEKICEEN